jgi:TPR repeat protein
MAADQGYGESQYNLGMILFKGRDTREQGLEYLRRAAGQGIVQARDYLREAGYEAN